MPCSRSLRTHAVGIPRDLTALRWREGSFRGMDDGGLPALPTHHGLLFPWQPPGFREQCHKNGCSMIASSVVCAGGTPAKRGTAPYRDRFWRSPPKGSLPGLRPLQSAVLRSRRISASKTGQQRICKHQPSGDKQALRGIPRRLVLSMLRAIRYFTQATAQATVAPTMGLLPMPMNPIMSTWAGTEEEPANCASPCIRPMESVRP